MARRISIAQKFLIFPKTHFQNCLMMSSYVRKSIGKREIVGYGFNGEPGYVDRSDYPMPAIRWRENTPQILALREKEKGDWNALTIKEKKALYRASFCQTYAEFMAPSGEWKSITGMVCMLFSVALWVFYGIRFFVYRQHEPLESFCEENRQAQLRRLIDMQANPIQGLASKWDYNKDDWK